jgi:DHA1 family tetracycline resistance protein-like MFS transporter
MAMPAFPIALLKATGEKTDVSSAYYGVATSLRFFIEFFAAPILGAISDARGRRAVFIVSLGTVTVEFFLLAAWPSITSVFISRILSGCLDATIPMSYAGMIDLAKRNEENVTDQFGKLGAVFGTGVIIGPLLGSIICSHSVELCFLCSAMLSTCSLLIAYFFYEDVGELKPLDSHDVSKRNPLPILRAFYNNPQAAVLSRPFILSGLAAGIHYVWILYMRFRFHITYIQIGLFMAYYGALTVIVQGFVIKKLCPTYMREEVAATVTLLMSAVQFLCYGLCSSLVVFYGIATIFCLSTIYHPVLKSLISSTGASDSQGELQGALASIKTACSGVGSLLFSWVFMIVSREDESRPLGYILQGTPFYLTAGLYFLAYLSMRGLDDKRGNLNDARPRAIK